MRCLAGVPGDARPDALNEGKRLEGWRLACQCRVESDLQVAVFDPVRDGAPARVVALDWLGAQVLRLRLQPDRPLRYQAGQHLVLWSAQGVARPYSLASVPGEDEWLEFHLDCRHAGAFCSAARGCRWATWCAWGVARWRAALRSGLAGPAVVAAGGGFRAGATVGIVREALRQEHQGAIRVVHVASEAGGHYLQRELDELARRYPQVEVQLLIPEELGPMRLASRQTIALACGSASSVERFARGLFLAGLPRNQLFADVFVGHA